MGEQVNKSAFYFTEKGMHSFNVFEKEGFLPFLVIDTPKHARKIYELVSGEVRNFSYEQSTRVAHRLLSDRNDQQYKSVYLIESKFFASALKHFEEYGLQQQIADLAKTYDGLCFKMETGKGELLSTTQSTAMLNANEQMQEEKKQIEAKKRKENTKKEAEKIVKTLQKRKTKLAKEKKPQKAVVKNPNAKVYHKWGVHMEPLKENATEEEKRARKAEYHKQLRIRKKEVEQQYIDSLSEEEREKYLAEKKQKSSEAYYKNKQRREEKRSNMTEQELQAERDRENMYRRNWYANKKTREEQLLATMSNEEQEAYLSEKRRKYREHLENTLANKTEEEVEQYLAKHREASLRCYYKRMENMTEEEYQDYLEKRRKRDKEREARKKQEKERQQ